MKNQNVLTRRPHVGFTRVHGVVDELMGIFHDAAKEEPKMSQVFHTRYKLATIEYLRRAGWDLDDFANACDRLSAGQGVGDDHSQTTPYAVS